jgi:hypothetical protein
MTPEELLKTLHDGGMDDETIKKLLGDTLAALEGNGPKEPEPEPEMTEDEEKAEAGKLLGVTL